LLAIDLDHQCNLKAPLKLSGRLAVARFTSDALMTGPLDELPDRPQVFVPSGRALLGLERQPAQHTPFARQCSAATSFVACQATTKSRWKAGHDPKTISPAKTFLSCALNWRRLSVRARSLARRHAGTRRCG
jgi:hypothetical protein